MKNTNLFFLIIFSVIVVQSLSAQKTKQEKKGDILYSYSYYLKAISKYKSSKSLGIDSRRKLADALKKTGNYKESLECHKQMSGSPELNALDLFNYYQILKMNGNYKESDKAMEEYLKLRSFDSRAQRHIANANSLEKLLKDEGKYAIKNLTYNLNGKYYGATFYTDKLVYCSTNKKGRSLVKKNVSDHRSKLRNYVARINADDQILDPKTLELHKKSRKFEGGPAAFSRQGTLMAITRYNVEFKGKIKSIKHQIFFSEFNNGKWQQESAFQFNNANYSNGHPWLSEDGNTMYFASDMPGGIGGVDLYVVKRKADGTWSEPLNLGSRINTEGDEMFPFYDEKKSLLFFSSDGHFGLGGFDIFIANLKSESNIKILNLGSPVNSKLDDYSFIVDKRIRKGYFSSNREEGLGGNDIFAIEILTPFKFEKVIKGKILDQNSNSIASAEINLIDNLGNVLKSTRSDDNGEYKFIVDPDLEFKISASKEKYFDASNYVNSSAESDVIFADLIMTKNPEFTLYFLLTDKFTKQPVSGAKVNLVDNITGKSEIFTTLETGDFNKVLSENKLNDKIDYSITIEKEGYFKKFQNYKSELKREGQYNINESLDLSIIKFEVGMDLAKALNIYPMYFDYNKSDLRADAILELDKIVKVMNENPSMVVELGSHTDCKGMALYNMTLSENRAKVSVEYIKSKISNPERLFSRGYGETMLKNNCACENFKVSKCSEDEHQLNRRTELLILKL